MPTNLALDDSLIEEAVKVGNHRTKKEAVTAALHEYAVLTGPVHQEVLSGIRSLGSDVN